MVPPPADRPLGAALLPIALPAAPTQQWLRSVATQAQPIPRQLLDHLTLQRHVSHAAKSTTSH